MTLPPLPNFERQNSADDGGRFEHWLERFEERAKSAKWTDEVNYASSSSISVLLSIL